MAPFINDKETLLACAASKNNYVIILSNVVGYQHVTYTHSYINKITLLR